MFRGIVFRNGRRLFLTVFLLIAVSACTVEAPIPTRIMPADMPAVSSTSMPTAILTPTAVTADLSPTEAPATEVPKPTPTAINTLPPEPIIYIVKPEDTLWSIAVEHDVDVGRLRQANRLTGDLIKPDQELVIPPPKSDGELGNIVYYVVEAGETFTSIADEFGLTAELLQGANPNVNSAELQVGQVVLLPLGQGEVHYVVEGDTLLTIAILYEVSVDDLVKENADILNPDNLDFIQTGWELKIPRENVVEGYDCTPQPPRTEVIEYTVKNGEKLYCLSQKFGVSMTTLLYANFEQIVGEGALEDGLPLLIPYNDGALYTITEVDKASVTTLQDLMQWYGISSFDQITDWQNNPVSEPLEEGDQLFIHGADLLAGPYQPSVVVSRPTPVSDDPPPDGNGEGETLGESAPPRPNFTEYPQPVGEPPPGAVFPLGTPWISVTELDTGFCPVVNGSGWTGGLSWPVSGRTINENRGFRLGHSGVDINSPLGSSVYAAQSGLIVWAGWSTWGFGNLIVIAHGGNWHTYYAHLSEVYVSCGQSVGAGATIGTSGQTGAATWPHLHFEVRNQGFSYNPANYLP